MITPTILVATWRDGLFVISGETRHQELAGQAVRALAPDGCGGGLAIVDGHSLCRRASEGQWTTILTREFDFACAVAVGDAIFVGTDGARVIRVNANGDIEQLSGFDGVEGRDTWFAGSAFIDGKVVGPPLGIRSITANSDGTVLLANVHVGGIPRSTDGGLSWKPTIDVESDVHEVCAHATRPEIVIAAAAIGFCISHDGGATWGVEGNGLHATYCSSVAFTGNDMLVSASTDHFAGQGAIYRRRLEGQGPLVPVGGGLPTWTDGIVDTGCIASSDSAISVADKAGNLYVSKDAGCTWLRAADRLPAPSSVLIV
jgi:hypothetical protein